MKYFLFFLPLVSFSLKAQTFYDSTKTNVKDTGKICVQLTVSGLPAQIDNSFGLDSVYINITQSFDADLVIQLQSPDGTVITLAGGVGVNGRNFINTRFTENGANGPIASGYAPFTGVFIPQQSLNILNNGQNPNGIWKLCISDTYFSDTGSYNNSKIIFAANPPPTPPVLPVLCSYCTCLNNKDSCDLLPDLTTSALCLQYNHIELPGELIIQNATPNIGRGPLEIHGTDSCFCDGVPVPCTTICPNGISLKHKVIQRIYQRHGNDTLSHYDRAAGLMYYDTNHQHLHIDHYGDYSVRVQTPNSDATTWPEVCAFVKQSYCLINISNCTLDMGFCVDSSGNTIKMTDVPNAGFGLYSGCGFDQGIYPGDVDVYGQGLNDPILLGNICNGDYYLVSIVNPEHKLLETNYKNNWATTPVTFTQQSVPAGAASFNYSVNGLQITFVNTSPTAAKYLWNFGDGSWDTIYNPIHTYTAVGTYTVSLVSLNQCYTMTSQVIVITGMNEYAQQDLNLHIYQNPIAANSFITYYLAESANVKIELTDILGKEMMPLVKERQQQGLQKYLLRDVYFPQGMYFLKVTVEGSGTNAVKIINAK